MAACIIAAVGTAFLVVGQHTFGVGLLSVAPWILVLDLQDYWRQIGFMQGTPKKSLMNDLLFNAVQALAFGAVFLAGLHSVFAVVSAWGLGAAVAALYGLRQFSVRPPSRGGAAYLWSRWHTSRWLAGERTASWGASQLYLILAGAMLGPAALGGLKAAQGLVAGPTNVFVNAGGSFGLPEASRQLAERGMDGHGTGLPLRDRRRGHGYGRMRHRRTCCCTYPPQTAVRARVRHLCTGRTGLRSLYSDRCVCPRSGSHSLDNTPVARTLHGAVGEGGASQSRPYVCWPPTTA